MLTSTTGLSPDRCLSWISYYRRVSTGTLSCTPSCWIWCMFSFSSSVPPHPANTSGVSLPLRFWCWDWWWKSWSGPASNNPRPSADPWRFCTASWHRLFSSYGSFTRFAGVFPMPVIKLRQIRSRFSTVSSTCYRSLSCVPSSSLSILGSTWARWISDSMTDSKAGVMVVEQRRLARNKTITISQPKLQRRQPSILRHQLPIKHNINKSWSERVLFAISTGAILLLLVRCVFYLRGRVLSNSVWRLLSFWFGERGITSHGYYGTDGSIC